MANPPIVIPPFTNVPAPGSPIKSDWPQSISNWVAGIPASPPRVSLAPNGDQAMGTGAWLDVWNGGVTFTPIVGHAYRYLWNCVLIKDATPGIVRIALMTSAGAILAQRDKVFAANEYATGTLVWAEVLQSTASVSRKLGIKCEAGNGTIGGTGVYAGVFTVEDIGHNLS